LLQNRIYRGEITHKGKSYLGEHPAIIERRLWEEVQAALAQNRIERATGTRAKHPSLLAGLIFDETDGRLTPTYAVKKGTRYRYYVSTALLTGAAQNRSNCRRVPAGNLEGLVIDRLRAFLADAGAILDAIDETPSDSGQSQLIERGGQVAEELGTQAANEIKATLTSLACRVVVNPDRIDVNISRQRLASLLTGQPMDLPIQEDQGPDHDVNDVVTLIVPARLKRVGREMRMLIENSDDQTGTDLSLLRIIARAHDIQARLVHNTTLTVHDVARDENVSAAYIYTLLRLPWLAPDITAAIVNGRQPPRLNAKKLMRQASRLPVNWCEQRTLLGL
jgi:site-specific DNA recombinase